MNDGGDNGKEEAGNPDTERASPREYSLFVLIMLAFGFFGAAIAALITAVVGAGVNQIKEMKPEPEQSDSYFHELLMWFADFITGNLLPVTIAAFAAATLYAFTHLASAAANAGRRPYALDRRKAGKSLFSQIEAFAGMIGNVAAWSMIGGAFVFFSSSVGGVAASSRIETYIERTFGPFTVQPIANVYLGAPEGNATLSDFANVTWHFPFHAGGLCLHQECDPAKPKFTTATAACKTENLTGLSGNSLGKELDDRGRPFGAAFRLPRISDQTFPTGDDELPIETQEKLKLQLQADDKEVMERLQAIFVAAARCAAPDPVTLSYAISSSKEEWSECAGEAAALDKKMTALRKTRFEAALSAARREAENARPDLAAKINAVQTQFVEWEKQVNYSDPAPAGTQGARDAQSPGGLARAAMLILSNPSSCAAPLLEGKN